MGFAVKKFPEGVNICYNTSIAFLYIIGILSVINYFNILFRTKIKENNCDIYRPSSNYNKPIRNIYLVLVYITIIYIIICFKKENKAKTNIYVLPIIPFGVLLYFWIIDNISTTISDLSINDEDTPVNDWLILIEDYINIVTDSSVCISKDNHSSGYCANKDSNGDGDRREYCDKIDEKDKLDRSKCNNDGCKWVNINDNDCSGLTNSSCNGHAGCFLNSTTTGNGKLCTGWCLAMSWIFSIIKISILFLLINVFYQTVEYVLQNRMTTKSIYTIQTFKDILEFKNPIHKIKVLLLMMIFLIIIMPLIFQIISTKCSENKNSNQSRSLNCTLSRYGGLEGLFIIVVINILINKQ